MRRIAALLLAFLILAGCANAQFGADLPSATEKPKGDYPNCMAVADFDDLMLAKSEAYTLADGTVIDLWQVDPGYYGGEEYETLSVYDGGYKPADVYALHSGEVLLVCELSRVVVAELSDQVRAKAEEYLDEHPLYSLAETLNTEYLRLGRAIKNGREFQYRTVGCAEEWRPWVADSVDSFIVTVKAESYIWQGSSSEKTQLKELGRTRLIFDCDTGEMIEER